MASKTKAPSVMALAETALSAALPTCGGEVIQYLAGIIRDEAANVHSATDLEAILADLLFIHESVADAAQATRVCKRIFTALSVKKVFTAVIAPPSKSVPKPPAALNIALPSLLPSAAKKVTPPATVAVVTSTASATTSNEQKTTETKTPGKVAAKTAPAKASPSSSTPSTANTHNGSDSNGDEEDDGEGDSDDTSALSSIGESKTVAPRKRVHRQTDKDRREARKVAAARDAANHAKLLAMDDQLDSGEYDHATWTIDGGASKDVQVGDIFLTLQGKDLLEATFLRLISGRRYGLIGRNGCGKTTLLRRIAQHKLAGFPSHVRALHVKQEVIGSDTVTVLDVGATLRCSVLTADKERLALLAEETELLQTIQQSGATTPAVTIASSSSSSTTSSSSALSSSSSSSSSVSSSSASTPISETTETKETKSSDSANDDDTDIAASSSPSLPSGSKSSMGGKKGGAKKKARPAKKPKQPSWQIAEEAEAKQQSSAVTTATSSSSSSTTTDNTSTTRATAAVVPLTATERLQQVHSRLEAIEAATASERARDILIGLQFTDASMKMPTSRLSGGWRMRVALAQALFVKPDILLLDEPTNHLDLPAVLWLQDYLSTKYTDTVLVVSHDRSFLNAITTDIIHFHKKQLVYYGGQNYDAFEKTRRDKLEKIKVLQTNLDAQRQHMQDSIAKMQAQAARVKKGADDKRLQQVTSRRKKLGRMGFEKTVDGVKFNAQKHGRRIGSINDNGGGWVDRKRTAGSQIERKEKSPNFTFNEVDTLGITNPIMQLDHVYFQYPGAAKPILNDVTMAITLTSRIAVVGYNGAGKSTFLNLIMDQLKASERAESKLYRHHNLRLAYFSQHHMDSLDLALTPLQHMMTSFPKEKEQTVRVQLARFGIGGDLAVQLMATLSGGQKSRVVFATVTMAHPQLLIFDEPTNHLDFEAIASLTSAINAFNGAVIVVSHDQSMLTAVSKEFWLIGSGRARRLDGGFAEYKRRVMKEMKEGLVAYNM